MRVFALLLVLAVLWPSLPAAADEPAGIVMAISGDADPPLSPMSEISDNTRITLRGDARLTFLHYSLCKIVVIAGGTVTLSRADFASTGRVESQKDGPCPQVYAMSDTSEANRNVGGVVLRGSASPPRWSATAEFIFTGPKANTITGASIAPDGTPGQPPLQLQIAGGRGRLPTGTTPLRPGGRYTLRVATRDRQAPTEMAFVAAAPSVSGSLIVLRLR